MMSPGSGMGVGGGCAPVGQATAYLLSQEITGRPTACFLAPICELSPSLPQMDPPCSQV